jgi:bone morphogenetic protein receptor type-1B
MAPEVVNDTIDVTSFSAFKAADMYSTSLVFWELCRHVFYNFSILNLNYFI